MNEEGDNPTVSREVQPASMKSLNDELTPQTDKPQQEIKEKKEESMLTKIIHRLRSFITKSSKQESQLEKMAEMECEIKSKSDVIVFLNKKLDDETDDLNKKLADKDSLIMKLEYEAKLNTTEIEKLELTYQKAIFEKESLITKMECEAKLRSKDNEDLKSETDKLNVELDASREEIDRYKRMEGEWKSRISQLEKEVNVANCKIRDNSKMAEDVQKILETVEDNSSYLRVNDSRQLECESENKSLIRKMEDAAKLKDQEIENLKRDFTVKMTDMENEIKSKAEMIKSLQKESNENTSRMIEMEKEIKSKADENDKLKEESTAKIANMKNEIKLKTEHIEFLQNLDATIHAKFPGISKLKNHSEVFSEPTEIDGISWMMSVLKGEDCFYFYLYAEKKKAVNWCCLVITEYRLISQKSNEIVHRKEKKVVCDAKGSSSFIESISFEDLFDEEKGYVKDDSITVAVAFRAFPRSIDEAKKITTLRHQFSEISKLTRDDVYSQPIVNDGITWKMSVGKYRDNNISVLLHAEKENAVEWWCPVIVDLHLVSHQKSGEIVRIRSRNKSYYQHDRSDCIELISRENLFNEKNGYVKDDSIIVVMNISVIPIK